MAFDWLGISAVFRVLPNGWLLDQPGLRQHLGWHTLQILSSPTKYTHTQHGNMRMCRPLMPVGCEIDSPEKKLLRTTSDTLWLG